jgi:hypothetical protein
MTHIQKAVQSVNDRGKYQFVLVGILILIYMQLGLILLGSSFIYMNPTWDCPDISDPTEDEACRNPLCRISTCLPTQPMTSPPPTTPIYIATAKTRAT